jgi:small-conductance mechanosensitive channel
MLQDLFSSFSIILSKPFKVGDYIKVDNEHTGIVKTITLKATHITSIKGHDIRVPNKDVLNNKIENYASMKYRRVRFDIGVSYATTSKKLRDIPGIIEEIIARHEEDIDFERVKMTELATYSIVFKISYVIRSKDYDLYLNKNQEILLDILERFEKLAIEIAYPTQTIFTETKKSKKS